MSSEPRIINPTVAAGRFSAAMKRYQSATREDMIDTAPFCNWAASNATFDPQMFIRIETESLANSGNSLV